MGLTRRSARARARRAVRLEAARQEHDARPTGRAPGRAARVGDAHADAGGIEMGPSAARPSCRPRRAPPSSRCSIRTSPKARSALHGRTDAELMAPWTLKAQGKEVFTMPKAVGAAQLRDESPHPSSRADDRLSATARRRRAVDLRAVGGRADVTQLGRHTRPATARRISHAHTTRIGAIPWHVARRFCLARDFARLFAVGGSAALFSHPAWAQSATACVACGWRGAGEAFWTAVRAQFVMPPDLAVMNAANLCPASGPVLARADP